MGWLPSWTRRRPPGAKEPAPGLTIADVREAIAASEVPTRRVWIGEEDGRLPAEDNVSVLVRRLDGTWLTSYFERGSHQHPVVFETEDAACRYFLEMIRLLSPAIIRAFFRRWDVAHLLLPDGWVGRPYDNWYELATVSDDGAELSIELERGTSITVPRSATVRDLGQNLLITDFDSAMFRSRTVGTRRYRPGVIELVAVTRGARPVGQEVPR